MVATEAMFLTDRQVEVLTLREKEYTQQEMAEVLGTTDSNVSAIERAAEENVEKAHRTLEFIRTLRAPAQLTVPEGTYFDDLVDEVYSRGDEAGIKVAYCRPELYAHLYGSLEEYTSQNQLDMSATIGLTKEGDVEVFSEVP